MKIDASMTIMCGRNYQDRNVEIELRDNTASVVIAKLVIKPENFIAMLGRQGHVEVEAEVFNLDIVGKKMLMKPFEFELPKGTSYLNQETVAKELVKKVCPKGWTPDSYFRAQGSFSHKGDKLIAHTTIRKWVKESAVNK